MLHFLYLYHRDEPWWWAVASRAVASCWSLSGLHGVIAWPVFPGIICYFSFCSDLCHTDTHSHTCEATAHGWRVVSAAIESPGQQVDKGDAAGGMSGGGWRVSGWRWCEGWLLVNADHRWEGAAGCRGWGGWADLGLCEVVRWGAKATGREGGSVKRG